MITTNEKILQLRQWIGEAGEMHYKRIKLAKEVISDKHWIAISFNGDDLKAGDALEKEYFGDLCGAISFWRLLKIIDEYPTIEEWRKFKFNLTAMSAEIDSRTKKPPIARTNRWSITQKAHEEVEMDRNRFKRMYEVKNQEVEASSRKIAELELKIITLTREKRQLEHEVADLQKEVKRLKQEVDQTQIVS